MKDKLSYKIGFKIGVIITDMIINLIGYGIVKPSKKNKTLFKIYITLLVALVLTPITGENFLIYICLIFILMCSVGCYEYIKEKPIRKKRKYFSTVFSIINLTDNDNDTPYYLGEEDISDYATSYFFSTYIPINSWEYKKSELEMYFNAKIIRFEQNEKRNRIINLIIQSRPLPQNIPWEEDYTIVDYDFLSIGFSYFGMVWFDLEKYPHTFIAGETGSGKSNVLKCLIHQSIMKNYQVVLIDFKRGVSFSQFTTLKIYYEHVEAMNILKEMIQETTRRLDLFRENKVDNIKDYNKLQGRYLSRIIIFIDELAELLKIRDKEISNSLYDSLETLTRLSRSVGIHLIMGIQRPDSTVVNGQIKNNVSFRVCGRFVDKEPSRIMLGNDMASNLPNIKGRFIIRGENMEEVQCFNFSDIEVFYSEAKEMKETIEHDIEKLQEVKAIEEIREVQETEETEMKEENKEDSLSFDFSDLSK